MKQHQTIEITILPRPVSKIDDAFFGFMFWALLVGGVGASEVWFNGSLVIDCVALIIAFLSLSVFAKRYSGASRTYTRSQLKKWVEDGMPGLAGDDAEATH